MLLNQEQLSKLNEMVTFVTLSKKVAIAFVLCNEPVLRKELYKQLEKKFESINTSIITINLSEGSDILVNELRKELPLKDKSVFFVYGIEAVSKAAIYSGKSSYLKSLNIMRDEFSTINHPVIIWSNESTLNKLANEAPDFWSWRTTVFVFRMEKSNKFLEITEKKLIESGLENLTLDELNKRYKWYLGLMEDYKNKGIADDYKFADWYFKLGMIHYLRGEYQEALDMYGKSMEIDKKIDDQHGIAYLLHSIAMIYQDRGEYHEALDKYRLALDIEENLSDQRGIASTTYNIEILQEDKDENIRREEAESLCSVFPHIPDIKQGWNDLHRFVQDADEHIRRKAAEAIGNGFSYIPDKKQAGDDLHNLSLDKEVYVRGGAAKGIGMAFPHIPDKKRAWDDLHNLIQDKDEYVRRLAAGALDTAFPYIPDKEQAWDDLHHLTQDNEVYMRRCAADALETAFPHVPDIKQAWKDLHNLTQDKDGYVRWGAANAVGLAFHLIPDKEQACADLHRLAHDKDDYVRRGGVDAIGVAFPHLPSKKQAWAELIRYSRDKDKEMRVSANYSLGRASIFKAAEAENKGKFREGLENALNFFKNSSEEATYFNPAQFCLPFYRSFHAIIFKKEEAEAEVQKYLEEAKNALKGSKSKEKLIEVVQNLGNTLKEVQKARDFKDVKSDLNAYRRYCERACELLDTTEEKAPGASRLIRKGLPIIDERIGEIIADIQEKAKALSKQVNDTEFKEIGFQANNVGLELSKVIDPRGLERGVNQMLIPLSAMCKKMPKNEIGEACELLEKIKQEQYVEDKLSLINLLLSKFSSQMSEVAIMGKSKTDERKILITLQKLLDSKLNLGELQDLCFENNIDYENIGGKTKSGIIRELLIHLEGRNKLEIIKLWLKNKRPDIWIEISQIREKSDQRSNAQALLNIAQSHQSKGEYDEALEKYNQSMKILRQLGDQRVIAYTSTLLASLYFDMGKKEEAKKFSQQALEIFEKIGLKKEAGDARSLIEKISTM
jgi:HEAT repeat protein